MYKNRFGRLVCLVMVLLSVAFAQKVSAGDFDTLMAGLHSRDREARIAAVEKLGNMKDARAEKALVALVADEYEDWRVQVRAIQALGDTDDPKLAEVLMNMLNDSFVTNNCPALKWNAAMALGNFRHYPRVFDTLVYSLDDRDLYVREAVVQSLGKLGDQRAIPFLRDTLNDKSFAIKLSAIKALGAFKTPEAFSSLRRVAQSEKDDFLRNEALAVLAEGR